MLRGGMGPDDPIRTQVLLRTAVPCEREPGFAQLPLKEQRAKVRRERRERWARVARDVRAGGGEILLHDSVV